MCECISKECPKLIEKRNKDGETPLFLAAHHDHMRVFWRLLEVYDVYKQKTEGASGAPATGGGGGAPAKTENQKDSSKDDKKKWVYTLCRRGIDGRTILHSAVSGEYYGENTWH